MGHKPFPIEDRPSEGENTNGYEEPLHLSISRRFWSASIAIIAISLTSSASIPSGLFWSNHDEGMAFE
jgi:hypothetical protein